MSQAVRRAIYGKMAGDSTLNGLLATPPTGYAHSIFYELAPQESTFPYVIFQKQAGTPRYDFKGPPMDNEVWLIKGVDKHGRDGASFAGADSVDSIFSRLDALLTDGAITISGKTQLYLRRESDVDYAEDQDGVVYRHAGSMYRLIYT